MQWKEQRQQDNGQMEMALGWWTALNPKLPYENLGTISKRNNVIILV
jgi:hypothetical protein